MPITDQSNRLPTLAAEIRAAHDDVTRGALTMAERALAAGKALAEAKAALPHGAWQDWLKVNTGLSTRTARRYMQLFACGLKTATVAGLGVRGASESIAAWPLPKLGTVLRLISIRHSGTRFEAFIWPAKNGGFETWMFGEDFDCLLNTKPSPRETMPAVLQELGFERAAVRAETIRSSMPGGRAP